MAEQQTIRNKILKNNFYKVIEKIGEGATAEVFLIENQATKITLAMKVLSFSNNSIKEAFQRELNVFINLPVHSNILRLCDHYEIGEEIGVFVTERMDIDLLDFLLSRKRLTMSECRFIFHQICSAISHLHSHKIAHCDIKPENILLKLEDGAIKEVKLSDFGYAYDKNKNEGLEGIRGTGEYMAPEIFFGNEVQHEKLDVWSVGVTLITLLTSLFPFIYKDDKMIQLDYISILKDLYQSPMCDQVELNNLLEMSRRIFEFDPIRRISIDDILFDPWVTLIV